MVDLEWAFYEIKKSVDLLAQINRLALRGYFVEVSQIIEDALIDGDIPEEELWVYERIYDELT
tara:strand:- start:1986 stop:2174 length:189 start_codon:yes stop_codon:yes gene_type:complete